MTEDKLKALFGAEYEQRIRKEFKKWANSKKSNPR